MPARRPSLLVGVLVTTLLGASVGCTSSDAGSSPGPVTSTIEPAVSTPGGAPSTTRVLASMPLNDVPLDTSPEELPHGPVQIDVVVGVDSAADRVEEVRLGAAVTINATNPDTDDEFVVAGYGTATELDVPAGTTATMRFDATKAGSFPLTSRATGDVLLTIVVR